MNKILHNYILKNWSHTIRDPKNIKDSELSFIKIPFTYTTPCADDEFQNFYYWDTYFTNIGLLEDGFVDVARSNIKVMKYFVDKLSFVPNADHLIHGSQPPFFTRSIYDLYKKTLNKNDIKDFLKYAIKEMSFWECDRMTSCGLNQYKCSYPNSKCKASYPYFVKRCGGLNKDEKHINKIEFTKGMYAIAESGWDLNFRYKRNNLRFDSLSFANLDLNCILYDAELKISEMAKIINDIKIQKMFKKKAAERKKLIDSLMKDNKTGIYYDYCFKDKKLSYFLTAASFYPYAFGISKDKKSALQIFNRLNFKCGLSTAEFRKDDVFLQWDYPHMWPPVVYISYVGLKKVGLTKEADKLKNEYLKTVENCFNKTGKLWEKYNSISGDVSKTIEYKTPTMMGWTAGVYEFLINN